MGEPDEQDVRRGELFSSIYNEPTYGKIIGTTSKDKIEQISLVSTSMLKYDETFIQDKDNSNIGYRPYFCEFFITQNTSLSEQKILKSMAGKLLKIIVAESREELLGKYNIKDNDRFYIVVEGVIVFASSPIKRNKACLCLSKEAEGVLGVDVSRMDLLYEYIRSNHNTQCNFLKELCQRVGDLKSAKGEVYNVGQANAVSLNLNGTEVLFDVGVDKKLNEDELKEIDAEINMKDTQYIILSHWDIDHFLGAYLIDKSLFDSIKWIAPLPTLLKSPNISISALRLCAYLLKKKQIELIDRKSCFESRVDASDDGSFKLWQGNCTGSRNGINNNIGLIIQLSIKEQHLLFTGDCAYEKMAKAIFDYSYNLVVVPHHGSENAIHRNKRLSRITCGDFCSVTGNPERGGIAIISVGENNYVHPSRVTLLDLHASGFGEPYITKGNKKITFCVDVNNHLVVRSVSDE